MQVRYAALLVLVIVAMSIAAPAAVTALAQTSAGNAAGATGAEEKPPTIVPAWTGAKAWSVAFTPNDRFVIVFNGGFGVVHGSYVLVVTYGTNTPYIYVYDVVTGSLVDSATGPGFYSINLETGRLTKLWTHNALANSMRGYIFDDKVVVATINAYVFVFSLTGELLWYIKLPMVAAGTFVVDSGFAVTEDGVYVAVGPSWGAAKPAPVVLINLASRTYVNITFADSRVLRLAIDPVRKFVVVGEEDGDLYIVTFGGSILWHIKRPAGIASMAYNSKLRLLAVGDRDGWLALFRVDDPTNPTLLTNITDPAAGYGNGVYAPTSLSDSGIGGFDRLGRITVYYNPQNGRTLFLHIPTLTWYVYEAGTVKSLCHGYQAAVSPSGRYIYAGDTLFVVSYQDVQAGEPRVRFWGTLTIPYTMIDLTVGFTVSVPEGRPWHGYFYGGTVVVKKLYSSPRPVDLVTNPDVKAGRLALMALKGMVSAWQLYLEHARFEELSLYPGTDPNIRQVLASAGFTEYEHATATLARIVLTPPPYFAEGSAWYGTVIRVPLDQPLDLYSDVYLQASMNVHTWLLMYDPSTRSALVLFGIPTQIGAAATTSASWMYATKTILEWYALKQGVTLKGLQTIQALARLAPRVGAVGIAVLVWGFVDSALVTFNWFDVDAQSIVVIAPVVEDKAGNRYSAVRFIVPREISPTELNRYIDVIKRMMTFGLGYRDVGIAVYYPVETWEDYKMLLASGYTPEIDLLALIRDTVAAKYNLDIDELTIVGIDIVIIASIRARETFWEWVSGGVAVTAVTAVASGGINVKGILKSMVVTDPYRIAQLLGSVIINGVEYSLVPGPDGAYAEFEAGGADSLVVRFSGGAGFYADLKLNVKTLIKTSMKQVGDYAYEAVLHYDWNNTMIRLESIEIADVPYPAVMIERTFVYAYGNFTHDATQWFELKYSYEDPNSPSGMRYWYSTTRNTLLLDPANGGILQPCKTYIIRYFYRTPPDAAIAVYLNGTSVTSTLARHATVVLRSVNAAQNVTYEVIASVKLLRGFEEVVVASKRWVDTLFVPANGSAYAVYDIAELVDQAIEIMRVRNETAFVEVVAKIVRAPHNSITHNDVARVIYYPPPLLPPALPPGNYTVTVTVYEWNATTYSFVPSADATIAVYYGWNATGEPVAVATTGPDGTAIFILEAGTYTFVASKPGFLDDVRTVPVYGDIPLALYLAPVPEPANRTYVFENATLLVRVYDATSGEPIANATVEAVYVEPANSTWYGAVFTAISDSTGTAVLELPLGRYLVNVSAAGYLPWTGTVLVDRPLVLNAPLLPEAVTGYARLSVIVVYADGKPYEGAHVEVYNATGFLVAALATNSLGNATLWLPTGNYTVSVSVYERVTGRSYEESRQVELAADTTVVFVVPWESPQPPQYVNGTPYYWLAVQVLWSNGLPFHGAMVRVFEYANGTYVLVDARETNGTGTVYFLLPSFREYLVWVTAVNPYTNETYQHVSVLNLTDNRWITVKLPWSPAEPELSARYLVLVYAYDAVTGEPVADATVVLKKGDVAWAGVTNATGFAEVWVPFLGLYRLEAYHPNYDSFTRSIHVYENATMFSVPLVPAALPAELVPPLNGTYPPVYVNGTPHYWLSIQVVYADGYPFHGANVTVYDNVTGAVLASGVTNGTGFVHFLLPANATILYTVTAVNPANASDVYTASATVVMSQHWYIVHRLPWTSRYYAPEVMLQRVELVVHRGQGWFFGNVSHLVLLTIWTNRPQTVTVEVVLYNATGGSLEPVTATVETVQLVEGVNIVMTWVTVDARHGGTYMVFANITRWEADTDVTNNWAWSKPVRLKAFVDVYVIVSWRPLIQKLGWAVLPEDVIEISIGVYVPVNTTSIPLRLEWSVEEVELPGVARKRLHGDIEDIRTPSPGMIWRNLTVTVPWTSRLIVTVSAFHPWEDVLGNEAVNITIPVDPDIKLVRVEAPRIVAEGSEFRLRVYLVSNIEPGRGIVWVAVSDNTTGALLGVVETKAAPEKVVEIELKAPENPPAIGPVKRPATTHELWVSVAGTDVYTENNHGSTTITIVSHQWMVFVTAFVALLALLLGIAAAARAMKGVALASMRFVRRR